jgi:hypothetical protein
VKHASASLVSCIPELLHDPPVCPSCLLVHFQEGAAFFFCLEDRALLCRDCDISIHTANELAQKHTRFLLTGIRVGLENLGADEQAEPPSTSASPKLHNSPLPAKPTSPVARVPVYQPAEQKTSKKKSSSSMPSTSGQEAFGGGSGFSAGFGGGASGSGSAGAGPSSRGGSAGGSGLRRGHSVNVNELPDSTVPVWSVDEILGIPNLADGYSLNDIGSTKVSVRIMQRVEGVLPIAGWRKVETWCWFGEEVRCV